MKDLSKYINEALAPNYFISKCVLCDIDLSDYLLVSTPVTTLTNSKIERMKYLLENGQVDEMTVIWNNVENATEEEMVIGNFISLGSGNIAIATETPMPIQDAEVMKYSEVADKLNISKFFLTTDDINYPRGEVDINHLDDIKLLTKSNFS